MNATEADTPRDLLVKPRTNRLINGPEVEAGQATPTAYIERPRCTVRQEWLDQEIIEIISRAKDSAKRWLWTENKACPNKGIGGVRSDMNWKWPRKFNRCNTLNLRELQQRHERITLVRGPFGYGPTAGSLLRPGWRPVGASGLVHEMDLHRFCSGLSRRIFAIKQTGYGSDTQRPVQAGCGSERAHLRADTASGCV